MKIHPTKLDIEHMTQHPYPKYSLEFYAPDGFVQGNTFLSSNWNWEFAPENVIKKCVACGQWGASKCECRYCGHPVD